MNTLIAMLFFGGYAAYVQLVAAFGEFDLFCAFCASCALFVGEGFVAPVAADAFFVVFGGFVFGADGVSTAPA